MLLLNVKLYIFNIKVLFEFGYLNVNKYFLNLNILKNIFVF